ncbi:aminotransferase class I/II-fold pyridoxal phosphate-dependent enzyme [Candidatus Bathyarchaeota archaeon]|nr:aminotransferase class I/II-fold pyridoxal phosphate-dependent enzyme [Candidatus Bathyarchaeota archaeon]NIU81722.1 aminotransferase class I/II-fold pyridoxal phosphate-dependent enzyme [Candidatus Bathyarchaeota archaeon]NIV68038.1 aminotransferase class I/II-fold pyridoxal phosphate-dependent enzyme [Candidatus Bathyarchaeota archaeon]NIW16447.1 aminotransferase class I/II-fold pyridoxal phosphate-dependent enzyme [Candidatus Bathyarchaeota archaeon]NIW34567.1 aminotransferase class I/II-
MRRHPTKYLREVYERLLQENLNWELRELQSASEPVCTVDGKEVVMLCANNYLNLATHPKVVNAMIKATEKYGAGAGSDRSIAGNMTVHEELDRRLAEFKRAPASLTYQTGFMANEGLIPQLCGRGDLFVSDELNHGSIIDGVRLTHADRAIFKHKDTEDLARVMDEAEKHKPPYEHIWILTDGVFSMDGDLAPLSGIAEIAEEHGAGVYVDDAHGEGVLGEGGRGIVSHFNLSRDEVHIEMGTFSKAFGVIGGHITGGEDLRNFAYNKSRTWLLSGGVPPGVAAACIAAIEVLESEPKHVKKVWENRQYFIEAMEELGFDTGNSETPIVPIMCGKSKVAKELADFVWKKGVFALPIVYPMVAREEARIRTQLCSKHSGEHLEKAVAAFKEGGKKLGLI